MERLSKNLVWMAAANIVSSLYAAAVFIYLARALGPEAFGYFSYVFTIIFFFSNFVDLGLSTFGVREVAKDKARVSLYVSEIASFRLIMACALSIVIIMASFFFHLSVIKILILESMLILFAFAFATEWAFQGVERMQMVLVSFAVTSTLQLGLIFIFIKSPQDLLKTPIIYFAAMVPIVVVYLRHFRFRLMVKIADIRKIFTYLSSSLVIWSISIIAQVYNSLDIFLLGLFRDAGEVGYFTIARRVIGSATLLMVFLANAVLPRLSHAFTSDIAQFRHATHKFLKLAVALTIFILLPAVFFSKELISLTVGPIYESAALPLRIMTVGLIFVIFNMPYSTGLIACRLEKTVLRQAIASAVLSVAMNIFLMPRYGMVGAAISFVSAEALGLVWILTVYERNVVKLLRREGR